MTPVVFALGAGVGVGLFIIWQFVSGYARGRRRLGARRGTIALGLGWTAYAITGWPVATPVALAAVFAWPSLFGGGRAAKDAIAKTEAVATWTETLRDTLAAGSGLIRAITASAGAAPKPIRSDVRTLAGRLDQREPIGVALRRFAADLDDPTADLVAAALIIASERQAGQLTEMLSSLAQSARQDATMLRRVEASRAPVRTAASIVTATTLITVGGMALLSRSFLKPYDTAEGQLWLVLVAAVFGGGLWLLNRVARGDRRDRYLAVPAEGLAG